MGREQDDSRNAVSRKKWTVVPIEDPKELSWTQKLKKQSWKVVIGVGLVVASFLGYALNPLLNPADESMRVQTAAKVLGIPLSGKQLAGVTFVKSNPEGDSMHLTYKCTNCGYEGPTFVMQYPKEPGPGWRKHDLAPLTTASALAMEQE